MAGYGIFMLVAAVTVGATVGLWARLIQFIVERIRGRSFSHSVGWPAILAWALGFAIAAFAAGAFMSIGIVVLPVAIVVCGVVAWFCRALPEAAIGAGLGSGLVLLIIGLMNSNNGGGSVVLISFLPLAVGLIGVQATIGRVPRTHEIGPTSESSAKG